MQLALVVRRRNVVNTMNHALTCLKFAVPANPQAVALRIPMKRGTDSGEVGQRRSKATLIIAMISEAPHLSQGF